MPAGSTVILAHPKNLCPWWLSLAVTLDESKVPGVDWWGLNLDIKRGGHTIEYRDEDPHIRKMFKEHLAKEGAEFNMPDEAYL